MTGYRTALASHGIPYERELVVCMEPGRDKYNFASGYRMTPETAGEEEGFFRPVRHFGYFGPGSLQSFEGRRDPDPGRVFRGGF